jgi:hypothetical protein
LIYFDRIKDTRDGHPSFWHNPSVRKLSPGKFQEILVKKKRGIPREGVPHSHKQLGYSLGFCITDNRKPSNAGGMIRKTEVAAPQRAYLGRFQEGI